MVFMILYAIVMCIFGLAAIGAISAACSSFNLGIAICAGFLSLLALVFVIGFINLVYQSIKIASRNSLEN